jgi:hypothetical protein
MIPWIIEATLDLGKNLAPRKMVDFHVSSAKKPEVEKHYLEYLKATLPEWQQVKKIRAIKL